MLQYLEPLDLEAFMEAGLQEEERPEFARVVGLVADRFKKPVLEVGG